MLMFLSIQKTYDAFFGPLRNIPGPFKFKFFDVVYASKAPGKTYIDHITVHS